MWKRGIIRLIVVALGASMAAAGQPNAADPNQAWDPAAHLTGDWTGVSVSARIDRDANVPARFIAVAATVAVTDPNGFLGLSRTTMSVLAFDPNGQQVCSTPSVRDRTYWPPTRIWVKKAGRLVPQLQPYKVPVDIPLDPNRACPVMVSRLEWSMYALVAGTFKSVDLPFKTSNQWADIAPGLQVLVTKASITGTRYAYSLMLKHDRMKVRLVPVSGHVTVGGGWTLPEVTVSGVDLRDGQGDPIEEQACYGSLGVPRSDSSEITDTLSGSGHCTNCGTAVTIHLVLGLDAYEKEVRFTLPNIPITVLWY